MELLLLAKIAGIVGLLLITVGVVTKDEMRQDILFIVGSLGLLAYSISLKDPIFITLQSVFILVTGWEYIHLLRSKK